VTPSTFHGKEGVVGSSPTEGLGQIFQRFPIASCVRSDWVARLGIVAVLLSNWKLRFVIDAPEFSGEYGASSAPSSRIPQAAASELRSGDQPAQRGEARLPAALFCPSPMQN
jgi:hypothetical protein